jgi:hypothetical protein
VTGKELSLGEIKYFSSPHRQHEHSAEKIPTQGLFCFSSDKLSGTLK